ncbi:hypothetical protein Tco_1195632 [Tanacetum coccineum]
MFMRQTIYLYCMDKCSTIIALVLIVFLMLFLESHEPSAQEPPITKFSVIQTCLKIAFAGGKDMNSHGGILGFPQGIFGFPRGIFSFPPGIFGFPGALGHFGGYPGGYGGGPGGGYGGGHAGGPGGYDGGKGPGYGVRAEAKSKKVNSHD